MLERDYQSYLVNKELPRRMPGCRVEVNDPRRTQGIPDLTIEYMGNVGMLEVKASEKSKMRPNQEYYVREFGKKHFCAFIYPENEVEVLDDLQRSLENGR